MLPDVIVAILSDIVTALTMYTWCIHASLPVCVRLPNRTRCHETNIVSVQSIVCINYCELVTYMFDRTQHIT